MSHADPPYLSPILAPFDFTFRALVVLWFVSDVATGSGWWFYWPTLGVGVIVAIIGVSVFWSVVGPLTDFTRWNNQSRISSRIQGLASVRFMRSMSRGGGRRYVET